MRIGRGAGWRTSAARDAIGSASWHGTFARRTAAGWAWRTAASEGQHMYVCKQGWVRVGESTPNALGEPRIHVVEDGLVRRAGT
jgi:hypothetical protein